MSEKSIAAARRLLNATFGKRAGAAFLADPHTQLSAGDTEIVHFQQMFAGIPLFNGLAAVHLEDETVLGSYDDRARRLDCMPSISAAEAVEAAQHHFRQSSDHGICQADHGSTRAAVRTPSVVASFPLPSRPTVLHLPRTKSSPLAHLEFHERRLVWVVRLPFRTETFLLLVAANGDDAARVVLCSPWTAGARCSGTILGFDGTRAVVSLPPPPAMYPAPLLGLPNAALLGDWIEVDATLGNNVVTHFGVPQTVVRATGGVFSSALNAGAARARNGRKAHCTS
jgi:hypothetical protein